MCRVGSEYVAPVEETLRRSDRSVLHASRGMDVHGEAELPHYLLMRCVSEMKGGKGRTSLGTALTGCYSTLLGSSEGRDLKTALGHGAGKTYLDLLLSMVGESQDPKHPKVQAVVEATARAWRSGEKVLIFCFRTHTAHRLKAILEARIGQELAQRREAIVGGDKALQSLRGRITSRDGELATLAFDRVLWSLRWAVRANDTALYPIAEDALRLDDADLEPLARLALRYGVDLTVANPDRVFVHRAVEHLLGRRLARGLESQRGLYASVLAAVSAEAWVAYPYGVSSRDDDGDEVGADERGVHSVYAVKHDVPSEAAVQELTQALIARRNRARVTGQISLLDTYADGPSFWLGEVPSSVHAAQAGAVPRAITNIHRQLLSLSRDGVSLTWRQRRAVMSGLRSAVLRESVLVRLLPERLELEESQWGTLLVRQLYRPLGGQRESMADRLAVFVEDLQSAEGKIHDLPESSRHILYEATRMRGADFVVLVDGSTDADRRRRVFAGFNSPLLPEVLVCTSVGQEGIDLHRHCRHVVHYDLAWNPAVVEQRTGRVDRLGSKTFRERSAGSDAADPSFLDVGVPFLAGTYDERMYEELRIRAQTFEVLTGGDVTSDDLEGRDDSEGQEGELEWALLPPEMVADLRVRLHVWEDAGPR